MKLHIDTLEWRSAEGVQERRLVCLPMQIAVPVRVHVLVVIFRVGHLFEFVRLNRSCTPELWEAFI